MRANTTTKINRKHSVCAQGAIDKRLPLSPRLIIMLAAASKKLNEIMPAIMATIIAATAFVRVPLKNRRAAQPRTINSTTKLAITMSPILSGIHDPIRNPQSANYCVGFVFFALDAESTLIISFIDAVPAMTFLSTCSCR